MAMNMVDIIRAKRDGRKLTDEQISWFIKGVVDSSLPDYQISSLLMAIFLKGMDSEETHQLTQNMLHSGRILNFNHPQVVDKHSTGGIGDKTSFILAPIAAACGVKVPMVAGRGLGHTAGTVDKIEAIKGFKTDLNVEEFMNNVLKYGISMIGQTKDIAPADKKIYALRDVTSTVESIPLITASIMSKKLAEGTSGLVLDVKTGSGAFMRRYEDALALADSLINTGVLAKKNMMAIISDMSEPLGRKVGHSLELIESVEVLKGKGPKDITDISILLAAGMIYLANLASSIEEAKIMAQKSIKSGEALAKFKELIEIQGGDSSFIKEPEKLPLAKTITYIKSKESGFIASYDTREIGVSLVELGGGRLKASDQIDFGVGFNFHKKIGDQVDIDEPILSIYHHAHQKDLVDKIIQKFLNQIISIQKNKELIEVPVLIKKIFVEKKF
jgi:pyrimidine-nucleoside phosphorylase